MKTMDLRKVRCMVLQAYQDADNNPRTNDRGPNIVVDSPNMTLYLRMWTSRETKVRIFNYWHYFVIFWNRRFGVILSNWRRTIMELTWINSNLLKMIFRFLWRSVSILFMHTVCFCYLRFSYNEWCFLGSMSEGIYRRPGTGTSVSEVLTKFRKDAWAVQLTNDKFSDHDVATALKRFFRDLPEPLLGSGQRQYFHQVSCKYFI